MAKIAIAVGTATSNGLVYASVTKIAVVVGTATPTTTTTTTVFVGTATSDGLGYAATTKIAVVVGGSHATSQPKMRIHCNGNWQIDLLLREPSPNKNADKSRSLNPLLL